ncbi:MAG: TonB-dependent receptor [Muribaculaceae bacterium]
MFISKAFLVLFFAVSSAQLILAQNKIDSIHNLSEVEIIGNRYREVIPSQTLKGVALDALNSYSVADALRYFSGVQIKDYGGVGGIKTVDIRSMGTNHMGIFYDGIQLGNAQNGQIDLGKFSLDNIEEISMYNGQKSEIFQSAKDFGSAGTVYLRTRRPIFKNAKKYNIKAIFRTGSFDLANPSILWEQKINKNISISLNTEFIYSSGRYKFRYCKVFQDGNKAWDTTAVRQNGDIHSYRVEGGINGVIDEGRWNVKGYFYNSEKGIPGAIVNNVWKRSQRQWDRNFFTQGSFQKRIKNNYEMQANMKYAHDYMRYLNPDTTLMYLDNKFWQQELYMSLANKYTILPLWDIALSADYQWNKLNSSLHDFVNPYRNTLLVAFASAFEWRRLKMQASVLGTFVYENITKKGTAVSANNRDEYTPAFFFSYQPFKNHQFNARAFYKRIFRMPTFNDLYYTDIGNISLKPEYTTQYNIGFQYTKHFRNTIFRKIELRADAYYNEVSDKIIAVPKGTGQYRWMMMNIGYVEIRGIDVNAQISCSLPCGLGINTGISYTYQKAQDFSDSADNDAVAGTYGGQISYIPWHSGSIISRFSYRKWDLNYSFIYVGERYHNSSNIRANYEQPWYTHDVTIGREFNVKNVDFRISLEVNNLFNQQYDVVLNYPMPGRNFKLILKMEI